MTHATITLRKATPNDAADLLILDNMSSRGMSLTFWQDAVAKGHGEDPLSFARERFIDEGSTFGWKNAIVAESDGVITGGVTAYKMPEPDGEADQVKKEFPSFAPVFDLFEKAVDDWFIDSLAVYPAFRRKGIAGQLLDESLQTGIQRKLKKVSLVVEDENQAALKLYEHRGFERRNSLPFVGSEGKQQTGEWLLYSRAL